MGINYYIKMGNLIRKAGDWYYKREEIPKDRIDYTIFCLKHADYRKNIVLLGDSTLDNLIWVNQKQHCVAGK